MKTEGNTRPRSLRYLAVVSAVAAVAAVAGCTPASPGSALRHASAAVKGVAATPTRAAMPVPPQQSCGKPTTRTGRYIGFSVPGYPKSTTLLTATEKAAGVNANVVSMYYPLGAGLDIASVSAICAAHKFPIIEIDTDNVPLERIVNGSEDKMLSGYALQLGTLQAPVGVDFNHEFNGPWFPWGFQKVKRSVFLAAWRHIVTLFRQYGATNVVWIWNPNVTSQFTIKDLQPWYPGDAYVDWVGLDGYFYSATDTYASVFNYTVSQIRLITKRPIFIVEIGANPVSGRPRAIASIFEGVAKTPGLLGLIWFDYNKNSQHNWYFNNDPTALAAFRAGATAYLNGAG
jgi:mannan endo-1,4-beta-mannosidase